MTLWWIGDILLLLVVLPVVLYLLRGVLDAAKKHRSERPEDRHRGGRRVEGPRRGDRCS